MPQECDVQDGDSIREQDLKRGGRAREEKKKTTTVQFTGKRPKRKKQKRKIIILARYGKTGQGQGQGPLTRRGNERDRPGGVGVDPPVLGGTADSTVHYPLKGCTMIGS